MYWHAGVDSSLLYQWLRLLAFVKTCSRTRCSYLDTLSCLDMFVFTCFFKRWEALTAAEDAATALAVGPYYSYLLRPVKLFKHSEVRSLSNMFKLLTPQGAIYYEFCQGCIQPKQFRCAFTAALGWDGATRRHFSGACRQGSLVAIEATFGVLWTGSSLYGRKWWLGIKRLDIFGCVSFPDTNNTLCSN